MLSFKAFRKNLLAPGCKRCHIFPKLWNDLIDQYYEWHSVLFGSFSVFKSLTPIMSRFYVHKGVSKLLTSFLLRAYMVDYRWRYLTSQNHIDPSVKIRISHLQHKKVKDLMEIFQQLTIYFEFVFYWIGSIKTNYLPFEKSLAFFVAARFEGRDE